MRWSGLPFPSPGYLPDPAMEPGSYLSDGSDGKVSAYSAGDPGLILESGKSSEEGDGSPLQYSCLENPMDRGGRCCSPRGHKELDMTE